VQFEYSEWDRTLEALLRSFSDLMGLFNHLLLMAAGDVDQVFRWLRQLQERGYLDADVDLQDYACFAACMSDPIGMSPLPGCEPFDFEPDGDVDIRDFGAFQAAFSG